jgi:hypothetical protein
VANGAVPGQSAVVKRVSWRGALRRHVTLLLAVKFVALALLWALCFSPAHRTEVDPRTAGQHLAVAPKASPHD